LQALLSQLCSGALDTFLLAVFIKCAIINCVCFPLGRRAFMPVPRFTVLTDLNEHLLLYVVNSFGRVASSGTNRIDHLFSNGSLRAPCVLLFLTMFVLLLWSVSVFRDTHRLMATHKQCFGHFD